ncbi:uncharacterized protein FIBRA_01864 [Fibroporia radiculosa]|uniref:Uncharacterized protein n=1 Tax=Fibroporia radiculosa TaxID=599839 RepID=J4GLL8_9APHY|nr:uncharacterized protein FIBRA_01864 [Fibroporia radiculosa]CCL99840.1 predicted protein [Fibroporia radiculosa]
MEPGKNKKKGKKSQLRSALEPAPSPTTISEIYGMTLTTDSPVPRKASREEIFHAILRSGTVNGSLYDTQIYAYSRRATSGLVDKPRTTFANSIALRSISDYFNICEFAEGRATGSSPLTRTSTDEYDYDSDSDLEDGGDEDESEDIPSGSTSGITTIVKADETGEGSKDGDDGIEHDLLQKGAELSLPISEHDSHIRRSVFIENVAFNTLQAFIFYVFTGKIEFAPLKSQPISIRKEKYSIRRKPYQSPFCSPKSIYRLADMYGIHDLQTLALNDIKSKLSPENIMIELSSSLTPIYPEVQKMEVDFLLEKGLTPSVIAAMPTWIGKVATGSLGPQGGDTLAFQSIYGEISFLEFDTKSLDMSEMINQAPESSVAPNLLSVVQQFTLQEAEISAQTSVHPFASMPDNPSAILHGIIEATSQMSHSLEAHLSLPFTNQKLLSLYRQHAAIARTLHLSESNVRQTLESLRKRKGITYGENIPLDCTTILDWCVSRLEAWGTSAGMEAFKEEEREGRMTIVLGGKVLVIDIDLLVDRRNFERPIVSVANLKTSYAIPNGAATSTTQGSLSLDGFLADRLRAFLTEVQKDAEQQDSLHAARLANLVAEDLAYLMRLDQLALSEGDGGLRWFSEIDTIALETERFAKSEAEAIAAESANSVTHVPLDIFLTRAHALPLPYLTTASISFLTYVSPLAYLSLLRGSPPFSGSKSSLPKLDLSFDHLRSTLASHPRPLGVTVTTLILISSNAPAPVEDPVDIADLGSRPTFTLVPSGAQLNHILPTATGVGTSHSWNLDFTDGGKYRGIVMTQSRMREIELVVNPLSGMANMGQISPMMSLGSGSWVDLLINPENPITPERYTCLHSSPMGLHPPLQLRLTSPEEPGFILERVPVRSIREVWRILEVVREQCWLNEVLCGHQWVPEGLGADERDEEPDAEVTTEDLQAVLNGTLAPRRIPVNIYFPSVPAVNTLFDTTDEGNMSFSHSPQTRRAKILMSSPERPPIPGLVEISITFDPSRPRGIALDINGAMGADLNIDVLEEVGRRGGLMSLPGRIWAKSHGTI